LKAEKWSRRRRRRKTPSVMSGEARPPLPPSSARSTTRSPSSPLWEMTRARPPSLLYEAYLRLEAFFYCRGTNFLALVLHVLRGQRRLSSGSSSPSPSSSARPRPYTRLSPRLYSFPGAGRGRRGHSPWQRARRRGKGCDKEPAPRSLALWRRNFCAPRGLPRALKHKTGLMN